MTNDEIVDSNLNNMANNNNLQPGGTQLFNIMPDESSNDADGPLDRGFRIKPNESVNLQKVPTVKKPIKKFRRKSDDNDNSSSSSQPSCPEVSPNLSILYFLQ